MLTDIKSALIIPDYKGGAKYILVKTQRGKIYAAELKNIDETRSLLDHVEAYFPILDKTNDYRLCVLTREARELWDKAYSMMGDASALMTDILSEMNLDPKVSKGN